MGTAAAPVVDDGSTGRGDVRFGGGERIESDGRFGRRSEGAVRQDVLGAVSMFWGQKKKQLSLNQHTKNANLLVLLQQ